MPTTHKLRMEQKAGKANGCLRAGLEMACQSLIDVHETPLSQGKRDSSVVQCGSSHLLKPIRNTVVKSRAEHAFLVDQKGNRRQLQTREK